MSSFPLSCRGARRKVQWLFARVSKRYQVDQQQERRCGGIGQQRCDLWALSPMFMVVIVVLGGVKVA